MTSAAQRLLDVVTDAFRQDLEITPDEWMQLAATVGNDDKLLDTLLQMLDSIELIGGGLYLDDEWQPCTESFWEWTAPDEAGSVEWFTKTRCGEVVESRLEHVDGDPELLAELFAQERTKYLLSR